MFFLLSVSSTSLTETNLKKFLFNSSYDKTTRPDYTVNVSLDLYFRQVVNIDEKNQVAVTSVYITVIWTDQRLNWSYSDYPLYYMTVKANQLWLPDLYIINTADSNGFLTLTDSNLALLIKDGTIILNYGLNGKKV